MVRVLTLQLWSVHAFFSGVGSSYNVLYTICFKMLSLIFCQPVVGTMLHKPHTKGHKIWAKYILYALCLYPNYEHFSKVWYLVLLWGDLGVKVWRLGTLGEEFSFFPIFLSCGFHILVNGGGNVIVTGGGKWIFLGGIFHCWCKGLVAWISCLKTLYTCTPPPGRLKLLELLTNSLSKFRTQTISTMAVICATIWTLEWSRLPHTEEHERAWIYNCNHSFHYVWLVNSPWPRSR